MECRPFFSIIIPTKARPNLIKVVLKSLIIQTYRNFEVIVSDDYDNLSCENVIKETGDDRIKYYHPAQHLSMCGNWENGLRYAQGQYIIFLQDKMFLYNDSLKNVYDVIIKRNYPDAVSWSWDYFIFSEEEKGLEGKLHFRRRTHKIIKHDINELVKNRIRFDNYSYQNKRGAPGPGTPLSAAIKATVYDSLFEKWGTVFGQFINPDYGPPIVLLECMEKVYEIDDNLSILMPSATSDGLLHGSDYEKGRLFLETSPCGKERIKYATVPGLYSTNSNMVSADYNYSLQICGRFRYLKECDKLNSLIAVSIDLQRMHYPNNEIKMQEKIMLEAKLAQLGKEETIKYIAWKKNKEVFSVKKAICTVLKEIYHLIVGTKIKKWVNKKRFEKGMIETLETKEIFPEESFFYEELLKLYK